MATMSVHDNHLMGYEVDGQAKRITLKTIFNYKDLPFERTDVVFDGVEAYSFRDDCMGNIIFDIAEQPLEELVRQHQAEFEESSRRSGWPRFWKRTEAETFERVARLAQNGVKWFDLSSSYGMSGWVMCRSVEYRALPRD